MRNNLEDSLKNTFIDTNEIQLYCDNSISEYRHYLWKVIFCLHDCVAVSHTVIFAVSISIGKPT